MSNNAISKPGRRWRRIGLRGLMLVVLLIGLGLASIIRPARIQQDAVRAIESLHGGIAYDWQMRRGQFNPAGRLWTPKWLVDSVGIDFFCHVVDVNLPHSPSADQSMEYVGRLSRVERLRGGGQYITDSGVANLEGLAVLSDFDLSYAQVSDDGLAHLSGLTNLSHLDLLGTRISGRGLAHLSGLRKLSVLDLRFTNIGDDGLAHLGALSNLRVLHLASTRVTDEGMVHLKGLSQLVYLNLRSTRVSDGGLAHLSELTKLTELNVDGTDVTERGIRLLQQALPKLKTYHHRGSDDRL